MGYRRRLFHPPSTRRPAGEKTTPRISSPNTKSLDGPLSPYALQDQTDPVLQVPNRSRQNRYGHRRPLRRVSSARNRNTNSSPAWGPQIGNTDLGAVVMLTKEVDKLGLDCNEAGWTIGWAMECYEKGVFTEEHTDGLDLSWGNVEAVQDADEPDRPPGRVSREPACRRRHAGFQDHRRRSRELGDLRPKGDKPQRTRSQGSHPVVRNSSTPASRTRAPWNPRGEASIRPWSTWKRRRIRFSHEQVASFNARYNGVRLFR